jgi:hypothetical protein
MTTIDRVNSLLRESTETAFDTAALVQRQNLQLLQTWANALETNQQTFRGLTLRAIGQIQEAQRLWVDLAQESIKTGVETATNAAETGIKEASEQFEKASRGGRANGSRVDVPTT